MKRVLVGLCAVFFAVPCFAGPGQVASGGDGGMWKSDSVWIVVKGDSARAVAEIAVDTLLDAMPDTTQVVEMHEGPFLDFGKTTEVDFGRIGERGGKQVREVTFKNSGNKPLAVTKTMVSCRCISISFSKKPVMPGGEGKITITYNPRKQSGVFYKAVQVYSNDPQTRRIVFVKGEVVE